MAGYSKELIVGAYLHKFIHSGLVDIDTLVVLEDNANRFYDKVGKDEFRKYADVTPDRIREFRCSV
jgi:hypothetical protein